MEPYPVGEDGVVRPLELLRKAKPTHVVSSATAASIDTIFHIPGVQHHPVHHPVSNGSKCERTLGIQIILLCHSACSTNTTDTVATAAAAVGRTKAYTKQTLSLASQ